MVASMDDRFWAAPVWVGSGMLSGGRYDWQQGLRFIAKGIGNAAFRPSMSGYEGYREAAEYLVRTGAESRVIIGHSNFNYFATRVAEIVKPHGIDIYICCIDRTMKPCPALGSNVPYALDLWAGPPMGRLQEGPDFVGELTKMNFVDETHISIIDNDYVRSLAIGFGKKWKRK